MKHKKPEEIETTELCEHGCGNTAKYKTRGGKLICESSSNKCPAMRDKNSKGLKGAYSSGKRITAKNRYESLPQETKDRMNWRKGKCSADFSYGGKGSHKSVLIKERGHKCEGCNLDVWLGKPITLELEHIDGNNGNNVKENLKLLCPNCHSQTDTWKGRNSAKKKVMDYVSDEDFKNALTSSKNIRHALLKLGLTPKAANYERAYNLIYGGMV